MLKAALGREEVTAELRCVRAPQFDPEGAYQPVDSLFFGRAPGLPCCHVAL